MNPKQMGLLALLMALPVGVVAVQEGSSLGPAEMQISLKQNLNFCGETLKNVLDRSFISTHKYTIFCLDQFEEFFSCLPGEARRLKPELRADLCSSLFIGGFHFLQFAADESSFHRANFTNS